MHQRSCTHDFIQPQLGHFMQLSVAVKGKKCKVNSDCANSDLSIGGSHKHMTMKTGENPSKDLFLSTLLCF